MQPRGDICHEDYGLADLLRLLLPFVQSPSILLRLHFAAAIAGAIPLGRKEKGRCDDYRMSLHRDNALGVIGPLRLAMRPQGGDRRRMRQLQVDQHVPVRRAAPLYEHYIAGERNAPDSSDSVGDIDYAKVLIITRGLRNRDHHMLCSRALGGGGGQKAASVDYQTTTLALTRCVTTEKLVTRPSGDLREQT